MICIITETIKHFIFSIAFQFHTHHSHRNTTTHNTFDTANMKFTTTLSLFALCSTSVFAMPAKTTWATALSHVVCSVSLYR